MCSFSWSALLFYLSLPAFIVQVLRKKYYNMVEDMKGKIRVYCRSRPLSGSEKERVRTSSYALSGGVRHFRSVDMDAGSRGTTAHAHQCCIFQGYPKAVPSQMKLTMREPASMTTDKGSRRVTSYFYSALHIWPHLSDHIGTGTHLVCDLAG